MQKKSKEQDPISSQGEQMDHASDVPHKTTTAFTHTDTGVFNTLTTEDKLFSTSLFIQSICFIRDVIQNESKNQQLELGLLFYTALSQ